MTLVARAPIELAYRIVDVFSASPLAGNALCVVLDPTPEELMPGIARETNLSETAFPTRTGDRSYSVRIFTPGLELPFAGHPTLGTAWLMGPGRWTQRSAGAEVTVIADEHGATFSVPLPTLTEFDGEGPATALGLRPGDAGSARSAFLAESGGMRHIIVPTEQDISDLHPDAAAVVVQTRIHGPATLCVVRPLGDEVLQVRVFVPDAGIPEDPGTGSAAGPIGILARRVFGTSTRLTINQGDEIGRPCRLSVEIGSDSVSVGGRVSACAEGRFTLQL